MKSQCNDCSREALYTRKKRYDSVCGFTTPRCIRVYHGHAPILSFVLSVHLAHPTLVFCHNIQQSILVGAGVTSVELRRGYRTIATANNPARGMTPSHHNQPSDRSSDRSVDWSHPQQSGGPPSSRRPRIFLPARDIVLNWGRFLAGAELAIEVPPVKIA